MEFSERRLPPVTREMLAEYAVASGDGNPIHLDDKVAKARGLPGVIVHGMFVASLMTREAMVWAGAHQLGIKKTQFRFRAMVFPDRSLKVTGQVRTGDDGEIFLDLKLHTEEDQAPAVMAAFHCSVE